MHAYLAKKTFRCSKAIPSLPAKTGDVSLRLGDGSVLTLTTATKLVINESIYDPSKENRSAFVSMTIGKARFWIKKLEDFKYSDFKVKTQTAVVGVRGSDFIVEAGDDFTKVTALENTQIEVVSLTMPCEDTKRLPENAKSSR
ncbi:MAG: FecR domain-containing protein [Desulfobacteraceae bacterium]|nr:FecR domain-containing protein [Desulfobacteraceae bacterium]